MKNLITCLTVCVLSGVTFATTWTVDDDGKADFNNIQAAVDASSDGDEIVVAPGTYTSTASEVIDMRGKEIWLHSSKGAEVTIIDGEETRRGIFCSNGETSNTIIEGFTIINGYADYGGGMYNDDSNPTLTNCTFTANTATNGSGGGISNWGSLTLTDCTFTGNTCVLYGAGMWNYKSDFVTMTNCMFMNNSAGDRGGGMHNGGNSLMLSNCTFDSNISGNTGGGMYNVADSITLEGCIIENNTANNYGGGMLVSNNNTTLINTIVCGNTLGQIYGEWNDGGDNTIADECASDCPEDITSDGTVGVDDLLIIIATWDGGEGSLGDINFDGIVNVHDLLLLIAAWGPCE